MHAFNESLRYAFLTKFDQHISDMTAVIVLKKILRSSFLIIWQNVNMAANGKINSALCPQARDGCSTNPSAYKQLMDVYITCDHCWLYTPSNNFLAEYYVMLQPQILANPAYLVEHQRLIQGMPHINSQYSPPYM